MICAKRSEKKRRSNPTMIFRSVPGSGWALQKFAARAELNRPPLKDFVRLDDTAFRALFRASPVKRIGRDRFVRNVLIAIGNSGEPTLAPEAERLLTDPAPIVRAMAIWALSRLLEPAAFTILAKLHATSEQDGDVRQELGL